MANFISQINNNGTIYDFHDSEFIEDNRSVGGSELTGISKATALFDGMQITYWLNYEAGINATLNLTLAGGTTTGDIPVYYSGWVRLNDQYVPGNIIRMTYRSQAMINGEDAGAGWWCEANKVETSYPEYFDSTPYVFRRSADGNTKIGNLEEDKISGGTVCWNQLAGNQTSQYIVSGTYATLSISGTTKIVTSVVATSTGKTAQVRDAVVNGHIYLISGGSKAFNGATMGRIGIFSSGGALRDREIRGTSTTRVDGAIISKVLASNDYIGLRLANGTPANGYAEFYNFQVFDLTLMFGSSIATTLYNLESVTAGAGVSIFQKMFPGYYSYSAATLKHVCPVAHKMVGINQWDEQWESGKLDHTTGELVTDSNFIRSANYIRIVPGESYDIINPYYVEGSSDPDRLIFFDAFYNYVDYYNLYDRTITVPSNVHYAKFYTKITSYDQGICISFSDATNTYVSYEAKTYSLGAINLYGVFTLDSNNELVCTDGDIYSSDGTVTRNYALRAYQSGDVTGSTMVTDGSTLTVYKLESSTTATGSTYTNPQEVNNFGTEEYIYTGEVALPVGHDTRYFKEVKSDIPAPPTSTNATYELRATVLNGNISYSWVTV